MSKISDNYYLLGIFWSIYLGCIYIFPNHKDIKRPNSNISNKKLWVNLFINIGVTMSAVPFFNLIPVILDIKYNSIISLILRYGIMLFIFEAWFYYVHRILHYSCFYKWHKDHHLYIHPNVLGGFYNSFVEKILLNPYFAIIPCELLNFNFSEKLVVMFIMSLITAKNHSGLQFYIKNDTFLNKILLFVFNNEFHDGHHEYMTYNYGTFHFLDYIHGTYK